MSKIYTTEKINPSLTYLYVDAQSRRALDLLGMLQMNNTAKRVMDSSQMPKITVQYKLLPKEVELFTMLFDNGFKYSQAARATLYHQNSHLFYNLQDAIDAIQSGAIAVANFLAAVE